MGRLVLQFAPQKWYNGLERWWIRMKDVTVSCRIEEDIKTEAEDILQQLGLPVSVVISALYRQIIDKQGLPFSLTITQNYDNFDYTDKELDERFERSYQQMLRKEGRPAKEVFDDLKRKHTS